LNFSTQSAVCRLSQNKKSEGTKLWPKFLN